jgi:hypothetical protein
LCSFSKYNGFNRRTVLCQANATLIKIFLIARYSGAKKSAV